MYLAPFFRINRDGEYAMAKKAQKEVMYLVSTANTGFYYLVQKKRGSEKLNLKKYDPVIRKHVEFKEKKKVSSKK